MKEDDLHQDWCELEKPHVGECRRAPQLADERRTQTEARKAIGEKLEEIKANYDATAPDADATTVKVTLDPNEDGSEFTGVIPADALPLAGGKVKIEFEFDPASGARFVDDPGPVGPSLDPAADVVGWARDAEGELLSDTADDPDEDPRMRCENDPRDLPGSSSGPSFDPRSTTPEEDDEDPRLTEALRESADLHDEITGLQERLRESNGEQASERGKWSEELATAKRAANQFENEGLDLKQEVEALRLDLSVWRDLNDANVTLWGRADKKVLDLLIEDLTDRMRSAELGGLREILSRWQLTGPDDRHPMVNVNLGADSSNRWREMPYAGRAR